MTDDERRIYVSKDFYDSWHRQFCDMSARVWNEAVARGGDSLLLMTLICRRAEAEMFAFARGNKPKAAAISIPNDGQWHWITARNV